MEIHKLFRKIGICGNYHIQHKFSIWNTSTKNKSNVGTHTKIIIAENTKNYKSYNGFCGNLPHL